MRGFFVYSKLADTWPVNFASSHGNGFFEVNATNFLIPISGTSPTSFTMAAADMDLIAASRGIDHLPYTASNFVDGNCAPCECRAVFRTSHIQTNSSVYDSIAAQLCADIEPLDCSGKNYSDVAA